ncbi:MAG TPA: hypothetical protein VN848_01865 [Gemmatimonadales bacterium]|nr:hypothetical protein [Gemmatimonadales bacterium]
MLSAVPPSLSPSAPPGVIGRPLRSLKQEYEEFMLQRIEEYKNALSRDAILSIGDEAIRELEMNAGGQYLLTEVLLLEHVDRVIARRLRLPSFPRWRRRHRTLRLAQREPTHWGLDHSAPVVALARRLEPGDEVVVIGAAALAGALFLAAHDAEVFLLDQEIGAIEAAEGRAVSEQLAGRFHALVIQLGNWLPDVGPDVVVIDPRALAAVRARDRTATLADLTARTRPGGVHLVLAAPAAGGVIPLAPTALESHYRGWEITKHKRGGRSAGFLATKPERQHDTAVHVSE